METKEEIKAQIAFIKGVKYVALIACSILLWGYVCNVIKLIQCDFKPPHKKEIIHAIGIIPPIGSVLGFIDIKDGETK